MSIIQPIPQQTAITLYKGIPWTNTYEDIRLFDSETERTTFMNVHMVAQFPNCSIAKPGQQIKLEGQMTDYMVCNYLSFINGGLGHQKVFYAFITSIDYININTFAVSYEIDWVQSYLFNFQLESCLVEREHVNDDTFGKNLVEEGISFSEYSVENVVQETYQPGYSLMFLSETVTEVTIPVVAGVACGTRLQSGPIDGLGLITEFLTQLNNNGESDKVVQFVMCPEDCAVSSNKEMHKSFSVNMPNRIFSFGNRDYTAKNNKMMCYPYKMMTIDNYEGSVEQFRYECFADTVASFAVDGTCVPKPCMICYPINYMGWKGNSGSPNTMQQFAVMFTNFPEIAWTSDTFRAWVSQNSATLVGEKASAFAQVAMGAMQIGAGISSGNVGLAIAGGSSIAGGVTNWKASDQRIDQKQLHGTQLQGSIPSASMPFMRHTVGFRATQYCIMPEDAKRIDEYFTRYGYKVNAVKVPNIRGRQIVNYVKTANAHVKGDIPIDSQLILEGAMNGGCSFWHTDNIGDKITDNPIVTT